MSNLYRPDALIPEGKANVEKVTCDPGATASTRRKDGNTGLILLLRLLTREVTKM